MVDSYATSLPAWPRGTYLGHEGSVAELGPSLDVEATEPDSGKSSWKQLDIDHEWQYFGGTLTVEMSIHLQEVPPHLDPHSHPHPHRSHLRNASRLDNVYALGRTPTR